MDRNKQVTCKICYREMRSDNLKRHMNVHEIKFLDEEDASFNQLDIYCQNKNVLNLNNIQNVARSKSGKDNYTRPIVCLVRTSPKSSSSGQISAWVSPETTGG